jgi:hypothetical protein
MLFFLLLGGVFSVCRIGGLRVSLGPYTDSYLDYSWLRRRILRLDLRPYTSLRGYDGPVSIAVDSSGVRVYGGRKRYIKIHFAVDINTKEAISMDVTTDDVYDSEVLPRLLKDASMSRDVAEAFMDRIRY